MTNELTIQAWLQETTSDKQIGVVKLNKPKALNALDLTMVTLLYQQLNDWQSDENIVCIVLFGEGEKAFCAGGDVVSMHQAMVDFPEQIPSAVVDFFTAEYKLDYLIHTYNKPIIVIGSGIVMGGGMGLFCGASHPVVTPSTKMAMPEVTIGLYPDVGASYFLPRLTADVGLFLGITGVTFNGSDAVHIGLAKVAIKEHSFNNLLDALVSHNWQDQASYSEQVDNVLNQFNEKDMPDSAIKKNQALLEEFARCSSLQEAVSWVNSLDTEDSWLNKAKQTMQNGSPLTAHIVFEQLKRGKNLTLRECFRMELNLSCKCAEFGEFQEGVRALLIDKDRSPRWRFSDVEKVPKDVVANFFEPIWSASKHPLHNLGDNK